MSESPTTRQDFICNVLSAVLCSFVLVAVNTTILGQQPSRALFALIGVVLVFLTKPTIKRWQNSLISRVVDWTLVVATYHYTLLASNDASGTFSVFLIDEGPASLGAPAFRTHWVNDNFEDVQFGNIARDGSPALFTTITVVPEPNAFTCILCVAVLFASVRFARIRLFR